MTKEYYGIIYKATNKTNGKMYVGATKRSLEARKIAHQRSSKDERLQHIPFMKAIQKYGIEGFTWDIVDTALDKKDLFKKEKEWIKFYNTYESGYNQTKGGIGVKGLKREE